MYGKIMVGIDGSEACSPVMDEAIRLAAAERAELHIVHVIGLPFLLVTVRFYDPVTLIAALRAKGAGLLEQARHHASTASVRCTTELVETDPLTETIAARLQQCADARDAALMVIGARGDRAFDAPLQGSIATRLCRLAMRPVLLVAVAASRSGTLIRGLGRRALCAVLACLCGLAWAAGGYAQSAEAHVAIFVYHRFSDTADDTMTVRMTTFETQLRFLNEHDYHIVPLRDVVNWMRDPHAALPSKPVVITVDDGHRSVFEKLLPVVLRERFPVTLFVYPSAISNASYALTWDQLRTLKQTGLFDIQSHTYWHPNFKVERRRRTPADFRQFVRTQLDSSRRRIESETGAHVDMLAWPYGIYDDELIALAADEGYVAGFTLDARKADRHAPLLELPRFLMVDAYGPSALARLLGESPARPTPTAGNAR